MGSIEQPPSHKTLFEIGSITKVFTATVLACLVNEEVIQLEASVCNLLPEISDFPPEITLFRLATHTSGLPRLPRNIWYSMLKDWNNPYTSYTTKDLYRFLRRYKRIKEIGKVNYSNLGVGLLGHILEKATQVPYEQLVQRYVAKPLGLSDTCITLTTEQQQRLATGHKSNGKTTLNWDIPTLAGAGALRSTMQDLLKFVAANLDTSIPLLKQAFQLCHETHVPSPNSSDVGVGLGWFIRRFNDSNEPVFWHNGATGGYQSYVSFVKAKHLAVAVIANYGSGLAGAFSVDQVGDRILETLIAL